MTLMACAAGKDVYVEKPLSLFVREGRWMVDVARRHQRIVQVGTQQRSGPHYQKARELVRSGHIGEVVAVRMWSYRNVMPGFGSPPDGDPPPGLDYDSWLGPAPKRPYNPNRSIYHFRWFWDYSGGQMTNLGQHSLDIVHWFLGDGPLGGRQHGGTIALKDNGETPDVQDALFEYPGWSATWSQRECSRARRRPGTRVLRHARQPLDQSRRGFVVTPDPKLAPGRRHPALRRPPSGRRPGLARAIASWSAKRTGVVEDRSGNEYDQFSAMFAISSIASARVANPSRTSKAGIAWSPPATWPTCRSAWAGNSAGTPSARRSLTTARPKACSNALTVRPGTRSGRPYWEERDSGSDFGRRPQLSLLTAAGFLKRQYTDTALFLVHHNQRTRGQVCLMLP